MICTLHNSVLSFDCPQFCISSTELLFFSPIYFNFSKSTRDIFIKFSSNAVLITPKSCSGNLPENFSFKNHRFKGEIKLNIIN